HRPGDLARRAEEAECRHGAQRTPGGRDRGRKCAVARPHRGAWSSLDLTPKCLNLLRRGSVLILRLGARVRNRTGLLIAVWLTGWGSRAAVDGLEHSLTGAE